MQHLHDHDAGHLPITQPVHWMLSAHQTQIHEQRIQRASLAKHGLDADGSDKLVLVNVSRTTSGTPPAGNAATADSFLNSGVSIAPSAAPLRGVQLWYDPRTAQNHLAAGVSAEDSFFGTEAT